MLRKTLLQKVKYHDGRLSHVHQTFQVRSPSAIGVTSSTHRLQTELMFEMRVALLAEGRKVRNLPISSNHDQLTSPIGHSKGPIWLWRF
jgi:hypothetical protein